MLKHVRLKEWQRLGPQDDGGEVLRGVHLGDPVERELLERLERERVLAVTDRYQGLEVRSLAHVGRITVGDLVITVEPKLAKTELLTLFRYAYGLRDLRLFDESGFTTAEQVLQDLLIAQLHAEARELVERGLVRRYVPTSEPLASPRGRIDMNQLAMSGGQVKGTLHCRHHPRSSDHLLNSVLCSGLELGASLAQDTKLRVATSRIARVLRESAQPVKLTASVFERVERSLNRLVAAYEPALKLIELLYYCNSVSLEEDTVLTLPGFLFDMNRFFQALLGRFLRENLPQYDVREEATLSDMMGYVPGLNPRGRKSPRPRPDFMVAQHGKVKVLLDAKYRDLWETALPRNMLYQLSVYALSQPKGSTAAILYPTSAPGAREAVVEIREPVVGGTLGYVAVRPVVLGRLLRAIQGRASGDAGRMALELAFGEESSVRAAG